MKTKKSRKQLATTLEVISAQRLKILNRKVLAVEYLPQIDAKLAVQEYDAAMRRIRRKPRRKMSLAA